MFANAICPCCQPLLAYGYRVESLSPEYRGMRLSLDSMPPPLHLPANQKIRKVFLPEVHSSVESVQFLIGPQGGRRGPRTKLSCGLYTVACLRTCKHTQKSDNKRFLIKYFKNGTKLSSQQESSSGRGTHYTSLTPPNCPLTSAWRGTHPH